MKKALAVIGSLCLLGLLGRTGADTAAGSAALSEADRDFVTKAAQGGMAEVEMGKMIKERAVNKDVKEFGQRMIKDHSKANDELTKLAQRKGATVPATPNDEQKGMADKLSKATGVELDRSYMNHMLEDHEKDVALFQKAAGGADDRDLQRWAKKTLPVLQDHLKNARVINNRLKADQAAAR